MHRLLCAAGLVLTAGVAARGDPPPGVKTIRVELRPAAAPSPALRYPLLPELRQQKPGNAVTAYRKAVMLVKDAAPWLDDKQWADRLEGWRETPLDQFPREEVLSYLRSFERALRETEDGARHEYVDWELTDKLRKQGISVRLDDVQGLRQLVSLLAVRVRLALTEDRLDDAVRDLQSMFAMSRHAGQSPTLLGALVGVATARITAEQVDAFIQHPKAPNLYWSLSDLPAPFIDLRTAFQGERVMIYGFFQGVPASPRDPVKPLTPAQADNLRRLLVGLQLEEFRVRLPDEVYQVRAGLDMLHKHEQAKRELIEAGWPAESVEKMAHLQVGVLHGLLDYERRKDEAVRWSNFPYWQAEPSLRQFESRGPGSIRKQGPNEPALPIAESFLPNTGRILYMRTRTERKLAALRCLEAIRLHAAGHDGKLPARLDDIKEVPIPVDPYTGKPFEYQSTGDRATLYAEAVAPPIPGRTPSPEAALSYEIVLRR